MKLREYFDINPEITYLNSGTLAICPRAVKQALRSHRDDYEKNPAQSLFDTWQKLWMVQTEIADFFNADPHDLWLRTNVTVAMNDFILGIELPESSEILTSDLEYGAITNICRYRAERDSLKLRTFHLPGTPDEMKSATQESIVKVVRSAIQPQTSLLMLSHVTTGSGLKLPIEEISKICREKNIIFVVDGAHGAGALKLDFSQMDCDFYGSNFHKWMMGPKGTGFAWVSKRVKDKLKLSHAGWTTFETPTPFLGFGENNRWSAKWMISSSYDFAPFFAIQNTLKFWNAVGPSEIQNEQRRLGKYLVGTMKERLGWNCLSDNAEDVSGPLYAFELPDKFEKMNFEFMNWIRRDHKLQIAVTNIQGKWHMRLAPQCYNTEEEINLAAKILKGL